MGAAGLKWRWFLTQRTQIGDRGHGGIESKAELSPGGKDGHPRKDDPTG
jgi:hypothetical protein